ncbi:MAG: tetraacyldisaccharide 4'-kinase [Thermodesulfobacteriota bacterium]|nr:tetraacyldisaccharide 4'-kinase [Thermodesulfobacteriota bacterium]
MLNKIKKKMINIATGKGENRFSLFESLLYLISVGYYGLIKFRVAAYKRNIIKSKRLPCKVISIGNITVGGTGKTPMTLYIAKLVQRLDYKVVVISRGYKGRLEKSGGVVSDGNKTILGPEEAGDEPFMMAGRLKGIPVIIGKDRFEAGKLAVREFDPDVIVLDDAFQHLKLRRDINLVLLDAKCPLGNSYLLPRGILREPPSSLFRSDALILTRADSKKMKVSYAEFSQLTHKLPVFITVHVPYIYKVEKETSAPFGRISNNSPLNCSELLKDRRVYAFAGIARNNDFLCSVKSFNCNVLGFIEFDDHHRYSDNDFKKIFYSAEKANVEFLITTEKDYARIAHRVKWPLDLLVVGVEISFGSDDKIFGNFLKERLDRLKAD